MLIDNSNENHRVLSIKSVCKLIGLSITNYPSRLSKQLFRFFTRLKISYPVFPGSFSPQIYKRKFTNNEKNPFYDRAFNCSGF